MAPLRHQRKSNRLKWSTDEIVDLLSYLDHFVHLKKNTGTPIRTHLQVVRATIEPDAKPNALLYLQGKLPHRSEDQIKSKLRNIGQMWGDNSGYTTVEYLLKYGTEHLIIPDGEIKEALEEATRKLNIGGLETPRKARSSPQCITKSLPRDVSVRGSSSFAVSTPTRTISPRKRKRARSTTDQIELSGILSFEVRSYLSKAFFWCRSHH